MAKPWENYQAKPWEKYRQGEVLTPNKPSLFDQVQRQVGRTVRMGAEAVAALPNMAMDAGMAGRNMITGENRPMPSKQFGEGLDVMGLPRAEGMLEKGVDIAGQMLVGSKIPAPKTSGIGTPAPSNFGAKISQFSDDAVKEQTIRASAKAGYKIPPSSAKPTAGNVTAESLGGKAAVQQDAAQINQKVTNKLIKQELGIPVRGSITHQALSDIRKKAGTVYAKINKFGKINTDEKYLQDLQGMIDEIETIAKDFPEMNLGSNKDISGLVDAMLKDNFSAKGAMALVKQLRKDSSSAFAGIYDPKAQALGHAQRAAADLMEDMVERHLTSSGHSGLMGEYRASRQMIAKTYSVGAALNEATGNVVATKIGQQLRKGKPLSGGIEIVGKFAETFPRAAKEITHSPGVSYFDGLISAVGAGGAISGNPMVAPLLAWPAARVGIRKGLMSKPMQNTLQTPLYSLPKEAKNIALPAAIMADALRKYQNN